MALDHEDLLQLSRIAEALRRSDPELSRELARPLRQRRTPWNVLSVATLFACGLLSLVGLVSGDITIAAAGGLAVLTIHPLLLVRVAAQKLHP